MESKPNITIKIFLVTYGYEVQVWKNDENILTLCRDFADDKSIKERENQFILEIVKMLKKYNSSNLNDMEPLW